MVRRSSWGRQQSLPWGYPPL